MKVTVFSTKGKKRTTIETSATVWGALKKELEVEGIPTNGMKAIIGQTKTTLESNQAVLPVDFDFTLFLSPVKVKSGATLSYKECRKAIKAIIAENDANRVYFPKYTTSSADVQNKMLRKYWKSTEKTEPVVDTSEEIDLEGSVDTVIGNLGVIVDQLVEIKEKVVAGTVTVKEEDLVKDLEAQFAEIEATM